MLGAAEVRISVTNNAPVIDAVTGPLPHAFDRVASRFTAAGEIQVIGYDVDGDPIDRQLTSRAVSTGPGTFSVVDLGDRITFSIQVPYATESDAAYLIGGAGLERSISMVVRDSNGGEARETWPILVENRPPVLAATAPAVSVNHQFDSAAQAYRATAGLSAWSNPDGDPLFGEGPTGDLLCPDLAVDEDGVVNVACSLPFVGTPALANFVGLHSVRVLARDPWMSAAEPRTIRLDILNRAPTAVPRTFTTSAACGTGACCIGSGGSCDEFYTTHAGARIPADGFVADADGNPLLVTSQVDSAVCEPSACAVDLRLASGEVCSVTGNIGGGAPYTASDGVATLSAQVSVAIECVW